MEDFNSNILHLKIQLLYLILTSDVEHYYTIFFKICQNNDLNVSVGGGTALHYQMILILPMKCHSGCKLKSWHLRY